MDYNSEDIVRGLVEVSVAINSLASEVASLRECIMEIKRANSRPSYDIKALDGTHLLHLCSYCGETISEGETKCHKCGGAITWRSEE